MIFDLLGSFVIGSTTFALYIALSPSMKGIVRRPDDKGEQHFTPSNLLQVAKLPLQNRSLWHWKMWDINYFFHLFGGYGMMLLYSKLNSL